jgi:nucleoside-diphosphate-sugar epimerase
VSKLHGLGWRHRITLEEGLRMVYEEYAGQAEVNS